MTSAPSSVQFCALDSIARNPASPGRNGANCGDALASIAGDRLAPNGSFEPATLSLPLRAFSVCLCLAALTARAAPATEAEAPITSPVIAPIRHSFLTLGTRTAIVDEDGSVTWEYRGGSRDGWVLPNDDVLVAWSDRVEEVTRDRHVVFSYRLNPKNHEIGTTQRLSDGRTLVTELGRLPRLLEVNGRGDVVREVPLQPETDNFHMQTRMARCLPDTENYLVPHLLAFSVKEYTPDGRISAVLRTDLESIGGRLAENWPFTAIRLPNGRTLVTLTHGNRAVELDRDGSIAWEVSNRDVGGLFQDTCGAQRLANGNTVIGNHGASRESALIEVTPERKIVWHSNHPAAANVHEFQILTTNGQPEPRPPLK